MNHLDHLTNLLVMATVDGQLTEREIHFLLNRCARWGISQEDFTKALDYACSARAELRIPTDKDERLTMLQDLIRMMAADGKLTEVEKRLFATAAAKMKLAGGELDAIIDSVVKPDEDEMC
jgi:uncharacterized tellurite resistance protein B-like protein